MQTVPASKVIAVPLLAPASLTIGPAAPGSGQMPAAWLPRALTTAAPRNATAKRPVFWALGLTSLARPSPPAAASGLAPGRPTPTACPGTAHLQVKVPGAFLQAGDHHFEGVFPAGHGVEVAARLGMFVVVAIRIAAPW